MTKYSRRTMLKAGGGFVLSVPCFLQGRTSELETAVEAAHKEVWSRFIDKRFDVLLHYAGLKGEVFLPTAKECHDCKPNGMSWSTPVEDGPFFGGLYLVGLCKRWQHRHDAEAKDKARRIAAGLLKLAEVGDTPGFVARGIGADGKAHYPASSEDQIFPWFLGLWTYVDCGLAQGEERQKIIHTLIETVRALESHDWQVPCDRKEFGYRGAYNRATSKDSARLLFFLQGLHVLTGDKSWQVKYQSRLTERPGKGKRTRTELCAQGFEFNSPRGTSYVWTTSMEQAALRGLVDLEANKEIKAAFQKGLDASAEKVAGFLAHGLQYERTNDFVFNPDWRFLNAAWKEQKTCDEAIALAKSQLPLWAQHNPRSPYEDKTMREPLFAAWIILLSGNAKLINKHLDAIQGLLRRYEWRGLYTSTFFIVVNIYHQMIAQRAEAL